MFSVPQLIHGGKLDFLVFDYLSEITMSLLTAAKTKMPVSSRLSTAVFTAAAAAFYPKEKNVTSKESEAER